MDHFNDYGTWISYPDQEARERRENPTRISDLSRAVNKAMPEKPQGDEAGNSQTLHYLDGFDKNSPSSLKQLRWSIYELIEKYEADYSKTISHLLKQGVEDLFKEYTNS